MSRSKGNRTSQKKRPNAQAEVDPGGEDKRHLSPLLTCLILLPVLGAMGYAVWYFSGTGSDPGDPTKDDLAQQQAAIQPDSTAKGPAVTWETEGERQAAWNRVDDAESDGWTTEAFANRAAAQWDQIKNLLCHDELIDESALQSLVTERVNVSVLRPENLEIAFQDAVLCVRRGVAGSAVAAEDTARTGSASSFASELRRLVAPYKDREQLRMKLKIFRVEKLNGGVVTHQSVEMFGPLAEGLLEEHATWVAHWSVSDDQSPPQLEDLAVTQYESVERTGSTLFSDCTQSALGHNESFTRQLARGYNHWLGQSQFRRFFSILGNPGIAVADVNGDDLEDIYVCQEAGLPNLLYLQNTDGTLRDESERSGANWLQNTRTALLLDLNNDGLVDMVAAISGGVILAEGDGTGRFSIRQVIDTSDDVMSLSAADFDQDGFIDLYIGAYYQDRIGNENENVVFGANDGEFVFYDANDGGRNSLLRNESAASPWSFRDVTEEVGLDQNNRRWTLAASWEDFDNDGDQDLYVANDYGLNNLYRNDLRENGRIFVDIAAEAGAEDGASGMSVTWGDYDRDGWMDLYVSNMFSNAGNRIAFQEQFKADESQDVKRRIQRFARGNTLLRNLGQGTSKGFEDNSLSAGVNMGRWAWASSFVDLNNDGWEDLVVANGYITTEDSGDL